MKTTLSVNGSVDRDEVAALLSVLPGAGHLYKNHFGAGLGILLLGNALVTFVSGLMALATLGLSLIILPTAYMAMVAWSAYNLPDWHGHHHYLHPWTPME
ncbi:MAG: hypothetical protein ACKO2G_14545 [Verrucomicrobiales bacterium]